MNATLARLGVLTAEAENMLQCRDWLTTIKFRTHSNLVISSSLRHQRPVLTIIISIFNLYYCLFIVYHAITLVNKDHQ